MNKVIRQFAAVEGESPFKTPGLDESEPLQPLSAQIAAGDASEAKAARDAEIARKLDQALADRAASELQSELEAIANAEAARIQTRRAARAQRRAHAMNIVTAARLHDGRPAEIFSAHDADTVHLIEDLLESVAGGSPAPLDPLFAPSAVASARKVSAEVERAVAGGV